ncbi:MAG: response regulator transcription factor [Perlucidibaca sp.]
MRNTANLVLLVEDHHDLAVTVGEFLSLHDIEVDFASNCQSALALLRENTYHCIVLDINLPDGTGYEVCHHLRETLGLDLPVIMLTARDTLGDKLEGFDVGADDYLVKPFELKELVARIQAQIKRARGLVGQGRLQVGDLTLETRANQVMRAGQEIDLPPIQFRLLSLLMRQSPQVVSRRMMELELWGDETPDSDALRSHLYNLRKLIDKPFPVRLIQTIPGVGVKLEALP